MLPKEYVRAKSEFSSKLPAAPLLHVKDGLRSSKKPGSWRNANRTTLDPFTEGMKGTESGENMLVATQLALSKR